MIAVWTRHRSSCQGYSFAWYAFSFPFFFPHASRSDPYLSASILLWSPFGIISLERLSRNARIHQSALSSVKLRHSWNKNVNSSLEEESCERKSQEINHSVQLLPPSRGHYTINATGVYANPGMGSISNTYGKQFFFLLSRIL